MKRKKQKHQYIVTVTQDRLYKLVRDKYGAPGKVGEVDFRVCGNTSYMLGYLGAGGVFHTFYLTVLGRRGWLYRIVEQLDRECGAETLEISHRELVERGILRRAKK